MIEKLLHFDNNRSVIDMIREDENPLVMYGAGTMAVDVLSVLEDNDLRVSGVAVDNEYHIPGKELMGYTIEPFSSFDRRFGRYSIVFGRSDYSKAKVLENNKCVDAVYCLTSPNYKLTDRITRDDVAEYSEELNNTYKLLTDDLSRNVFISWLNARINDDASLMFPFYDGQDRSYFDNDIFSISEDCNFVDIGAFTGDTVEQYHNICNNGYIWAFEADDDNYQILQKTVKRIDHTYIELHNTALWSEHRFASWGGGCETGFVDAKGDAGDIELYTLDELMTDRVNKAGLLKINFPGIDEVLKGAVNVIGEDHPYLALRVGFNKYEIGTVPAWIHENFPEYKLFMRYNMCIPAGLCLYARI